MPEGGEVLQVPRCGQRGVGAGARGEAASCGDRDQRPTASLAARVNSPLRERWGFC